MKPSELKEMIKEVIRKEVSAEVNKQMVKLVAQIIKETRTSKQTPTQNIVEAKHQTVQRRQQMKITGNPALDAVLSDTEPFTKEERGEQGNFAQLMSETFDKIGGGQEVISEPKTKMDFLKSIVSPSPQQQSVVDSAPAEIKQKLFNKDFRSILKRSMAGSGGSINPMQLFSGEGQSPRDIPQG